MSDKVICDGCGHDGGCSPGCGRVKAWAIGYS